MLESIQEFFNNNTIMILIAVGAMIAIVAFVVFRKNGNVAGHPEMINTPPQDLEGMDNVNMVCDLANGICHPQQMTMQQDQQATEEAPQNDA
jgi:hypothetical protein